MRSIHSSSTSHLLVNHVVWAIMVVIVIMPILGN